MSELEAPGTAAPQPPRSTDQVRALLEAIPYCRFLGITVEDGAERKETR